MKRQQVKIEIQSYLLFPAAVLNLLKVTISEQNIGKVMAKSMFQEIETRLNFCEQSFADRKIGFHVVVNQNFNDILNSCTSKFLSLYCINFLISLTGKLVVLCTGTIINMIYFAYFITHILSCTFVLMCT